MSGANWPARRSGGVSRRSSAPGSCCAARLPGCSAAGRMRPSGRILPFLTIRNVWQPAPQSATHPDTAVLFEGCGSRLQGGFGCRLRDVWADWSSAAGCPAAERREAHSSHLWAEGESAHGLPGAVSDEYGQFRSPLRDGLAPAR